MKCSIASGSISSQKPAFFSLTLQSRSMIHRHTEIWKWQGSTSASPLIQEICFLSLQMGFSFVRAAVACSILERTSGLEPSSETTGTGSLLQCPASVLLPLSHSGCHWHCLSSVWSSPLLSFYLYLTLDAIGIVCHQFGLLRTDLHLIPCAGFVETFY